MMKIFIIVSALILFVSIGHASVKYIYDNEMNLVGVETVNIPLFVPYNARRADKPWPAWKIPLCPYFKLDRHCLSCHERDRTIKQYKGNEKTD